jgi:hypothetical protein
MLAMCNGDDALKRVWYSNVVVWLNDYLSKPNDEMSVSKSEESVAVIKIY